MYLVGAAHKNKDKAQRLIERAVRNREALVTDAEVLQEILHRYVAIDRPDAIQPAFDAILGLVDEVFSITVDDVKAAKTLILGRPGKASARDAIHIAVMQRLDITRIITFDRDYDRFETLERLS